MARLAKIIGISEYTNWPVLKNPVNGAGKVLDKLGFDTKIFKNMLV